MIYKKDVPVILPKDIFIGHPKAPVTLMEYGDYECETGLHTDLIVREVLQTLSRDGQLQLSSLPTAEDPPARPQGGRGGDRGGTGGEIPSDARHHPAQSPKISAPRACPSTPGNWASAVSTSSTHSSRENMGNTCRTIWPQV